VIYLDHNATTPVLPEVLEAMMPYFKAEWGNPSSSYKFGSKLKTVIETAREQVADLIGAQPREMIFTCCATESNNAAIHAALKTNPKKRHIVTSAVEHSSVLNYCMALEREGYRVTYLPVDREGLLKLADLESAITGEAIACLTSSKCLRARGALGPPGTQVEYGLAPASQALLHKTGDRINLHALRAPPEYAVRRRVSAPDDIHPKALLRRRAKELDFDVEILLSGAFPHLGQRHLDHFHNGRYLDAGVSADDGNFLLSLLCWNGLDGVENERGDQGAVFAATKSDEPRTRVSKVKFPQ
jgi:hypothetical protein